MLPTIDRFIIIISLLKASPKQTLVSGREILEGRACFSFPLLKSYKTFIK